MNDDGIFIGVIGVLVIILIFAFGMGIGDGLARNEDPEEIGKKLASICEVYEKKPVIKETKLPNGNLGFYITCE